MLNGMAGHLPSCLRAWLEAAGLIAERMYGDKVDLRHAASSQQVEGGSNRSQAGKKTKKNLFAFRIDGRFSGAKRSGKLFVDRVEQDR